MNCKEIAFIICINDIQYYEECVRYIKDLDVPDGYSIDIISIQEAETIAQGYNAAMQSSNAKYKVYLHQDTFILNKNFIKDILRIFSQDKTVGMIGMLGNDCLMPDEKFESVWQLGNAKIYDGRCSTERINQWCEEKEYLPVKAISGFLMATQYDISWREDILDGWDFYEISHSLEMQRQGYQVVVPYQSEAWCYHDCCVSKYRDYGTYWKKFAMEYPELEWKSIDEQKLLRKKEEISNLSSVRERLIYYITRKEYDSLCKVAEDIRSSWLEDIIVREFVNMMEIYFLESNNIDKIHSYWWELQSWEEMYNEYRWIRFVVMRIAYKREDERISELKTMVQNKEVTRDAIRKIAAETVGDFFHIYEELLHEERDEPLVSVILPAYNCADIIGETLESIIQQTYHNMEIIIIDDASTDNSREVISSYHDSRIRTIFLDKNHHVCYALNVGLQAAKGKYIALTAHDDLWKKDKISKQIQFLEEHPVYSVCFTWANIVDENGNGINEEWNVLYQLFHSDNLSQNQWIRRLLVGGNSFCGASACVRSEFLQKTGYYHYSLVQLQDYDMWLRLLLEGPVYVLQENLTLYRRFSQAGRNLSEINQKTRTRDRHETQWIQDSIIDKLSDEKFIEIFKKELRYPKAESRKEVLCEKAFLLWALRNCFVEKRFIELLEDEECRNILEEKYQFSLKDFYEMNSQALYFD